MENYAHSHMELASRDITSHAINREIMEGRGVYPDSRLGGPCVYLDLRHMGQERIMSRIPFCWEEAHRLVGIDAVYEPIPVRPTVHYCMGGIPVNTQGRVRLSKTELTEGFFAAGECACFSVHGANRLGSNSLLECIVYGRITGRNIAEYVQNHKFSEIDPHFYLAKAKKRIQTLLNKKGTMRLGVLRQQFQNCMSDHCGGFRNKKKMEEGLAKIQQFRSQYKQVYLDDKDLLWNTELIEAIELQNIMILG